MQRQLLPKQITTIIVCGLLLSIVALYTVTVPAASATAAPSHKNITVAPHTLTLTFTQVLPGIVSVHTLAGAKLTIKVLYACSKHYATSQSLRGTVLADGSGNYIWIWTIGSQCHGIVTAFVSASANGKSISNHTTFND